MAMKVDNITLILFGAFVIYQFFNPCNHRAFLGVVAFGTCYALHQDLNSSIIVGCVVALSNDVYKQFIKGTRENFEDKKETLEKLLNEEKYDVEKMINMKDTLKQNLGNIDKEALQDMTNEAKEFMEQQKELFSLIETLGPALKEGISLMNSFSNFSKDISK